MARMLEAYLAFARGDSGEQSAPTDMARLPRRAEGRRRAQRPPAPASRSTASRSSRCGRRRSSAASPISYRMRRAHAPSIVDHRPPRPPLADRHGRRRRPGHSARTCARRCSSRSFGSTTRAIRTKAAPGLGLAIARDIARSHGGDIMLADSPDGRLARDGAGAGVGPRTQSQHIDSAASAFFVGNGRKRTQREVGAWVQHGTRALQQAGILIRRHVEAGMSVRTQSRRHPRDG